MPNYLEIITVHYTTSHHIILHYITLNHITSHHSTAQHGMAHFIILQHITSRHIPLNYATLYYIALYYTILHYITFVLPNYRTSSLGLPCKDANCVPLYKGSCFATKQQQNRYIIALPGKVLQKTAKNSKLCFACKQSWGYLTTHQSISHRQ